MTDEQPKQTLYIFIDESGDFNFSKKGSKYFILTSVSTIKPLKGRGSVLGTRYELLADGIDSEYFHATEDSQKIRDNFYAVIKELVDFEIDSVIAEKCKAHPLLYEEIETNGDFSIKSRKGVEERFYRQICETLLQYVIRRYKNKRISKIVVILDQIMTNKKKDFVTKSIKTYMKEHFGLTPYIYFHQTKADLNSQIADYCCWAMKKKWCDDELRPYNEIKNKVKSEFDIFRKGTTKHY